MSAACFDNGQAADCLVMHGAARMMPRIISKDAGRALIRGDARLREQSLQRLKVAQTLLQNCKRSQANKTSLDYRPSCGQRRACPLMTLATSRR